MTRKRVDAGEDSRLSTVVVKRPPRRPAPPLPTGEVLLDPPPEVPATAGQSGAPLLTGLTHAARGPPAGRARGGGRGRGDGLDGGRRARRSTRLCRRWDVRGVRARHDGDDGHRPGRGRQAGDEGGGGAGEGAPSAGSAAAG